MNKLNNNEEIINVLSSFTNEEAESISKELMNDKDYYNYLKYNLNEDDKEIIEDYMNSILNNRPYSSELKHLHVMLITKHYLEYVNFKLNRLDNNIDNIIDNSLQELVDNKDKHQNYACIIGSVAGGLFNVITERGNMLPKLIGTSIGCFTGLIIKDLASDTFNEPLSLGMVTFLISKVTGECINNVW